MEANKKLKLPSKLKVASAPIFHTRSWIMPGGWNSLMSASREICKARVNLQPLPKSFPSQSFAPCHNHPCYRVSLVTGVTSSKSQRDGGDGKVDLRDAWNIFWQGLLKMAERERPRGYASAETGRSHPGEWGGGRCSRQRSISGNGNFMSRSKRAYHGEQWYRPCFQNEPKI